MQTQTIKTLNIQPNICISLTEPMVVLSATENIYELLGFKAVDFLNGIVSVRSRIHTHDQDIAKTLFSPEINPKSNTVNIRIRHADNRIRCIKVLYSKRFDPINNYIILDLFLQDAKSLWEPQGDQTAITNFKTMMENTDDYIYFKDRNHVFTGASQTLVAITDPSEHWTDLIGKTDYDVFPEENADVYYSLERQVFSGIQVARDIQQYVRNDGTKGWVNNRKYPVKNDDGEIIGLFGIAHDITNSIQAGLYEQFYTEILEKLAKRVALIGIIDEIIFAVERLQPEVLCSISIEDSDGQNIIRNSVQHISELRDIENNRIEEKVGTNAYRMQIFSAQPFTSDKNKNHLFTDSYKELVAKVGLSACWSQPILSSTNQALGTFYIYHKMTNTEKFQDIAIFTLATHLASIAIERKQLDDSLIRSESKFRTLFDTSRDAVMMLDENGFFDGNQAALNLFGLKSRDELRYYHPVDLSPVTQECGTDSVTLAKRHMDEAMQTGSSHFEWLHKTAHSGNVFIADVLLTSLIIDGKLVLQTTVRDITKRKKMEEEVRQLAFYDPLTKLPNRRLLDDRLGLTIACCKRSGSYGALMFLDLDNFKPLNDLHGHAVGDILLHEAANRIKNCVRKVDTVARFGGDEFVVLLNELDMDKTLATSQAEIVAEKIRAALSGLYTLTNTHADQSITLVEHSCTGSIGVVVFSGSQGNQDDIMKWADSAMYEAKHSGRNQIRFYYDKT